MQHILVNEATAGERRIPVVLVDDTDGKTPETAITPSASELQVSQNGGSFANFAGTWTEVGGGDYYYTPSTGEVNQMGYLAIRLVKSGIRTYRDRVQIVANDPYGAFAVTLQGGSIGSGTFATGAITAAALAADAGAEIADAVWDEAMAGHQTVGTYGRRLGSWVEGQVLTSGSNTALTFLTNLASTTSSAYVDALITFHTGALAGQVKKITAYNGTTKFVTVLGGFTAAPANTDQFSIENA